MANRLLPRFITTRPAAIAAYRLIRLYSLTFRVRIVGEEVWRDHLAGGGRILLAGWHQQFLTAIRHYKVYSDLSPSLMISRSADGELISGVARRTGWHPVRGSSSSGGMEALDEMIERVRSTRFGGHIVDGPRGPAGRVKKGLIRLAQGSGAAIVPFYGSADRCWYARSWDRCLLPKPGARVTLRFADPISLQPTTDPAELEQQRRDIEALMRRDGWNELNQET